MVAPRRRRPDPGGRRRGLHHGAHPGRVLQHARPRHARDPDDPAGASRPFSRVATGSSSPRARASSSSGARDTPAPRRPDPRRTRRLRRVRRRVPPHRPGARGEGRRARCAPRSTTPASRPMRSTSSTRTARRRRSTTWSRPARSAGLRRPRRPARGPLDEVDDRAPVGAPPRSRPPPPCSRSRGGRSTPRSTCTTPIRRATSTTCQRGCPLRARPAVRASRTPWASGATMAARSSAVHSLGERPAARARGRVRRWRRSSSPSGSCSASCTGRPAADRPAGRADGRLRRVRHAALAPGRRTPPHVTS